MGIRSRRAILLYGSHGNGKTTLIKALINESKVKYFYVNATDLIGHDIGIGSKMIKRKSN